MTLESRELPDSREAFDKLLLGGAQIPVVKRRLWYVDRSLPGDPAAKRAGNGAGVLGGAAADSP